MLFHCFVEKNQYPPFQSKFSWIYCFYLVFGTVFVIFFFFFFKWHFLRLLNISQLNASLNNIGLPMSSIFTLWNTELKCALVSASMNLTVLSIRRDVIRFLYVNLAATDFFIQNRIQLKGITLYTRICSVAKWDEQWVWIEWRDDTLVWDIFSQCKNRLMIISNGHPQFCNAKAPNTFSNVCVWRENVAKATKCKRLIQTWIGSNHFYTIDSAIERK